MLEPKQLVACSVRIGEVRHAPVRYHLSAELRQRDPRVFLLKSGPRGRHEMKTYFTVRASVGQQASFTHISALDNPDLARGRTHLGGNLLGYEAERSVQVAAARDFLKYDSRPVVSRWLHA